MLNERGGFESDLTVMRLPPERGSPRFLLVTGSAQPVRDADWINRHIRADEFAVLTDVSTMWSVLSVMGPRAAELMRRVSPDDRSLSALKFSHTCEIDLGHARVRAARMSYVGGPGFELYVPVEMARHVYLALREAGADLGLADAGYFAIDARRIEAGRRAWGAELGPDEMPFEAGIDFAVRLDKPGGFIGRDAGLAQKSAGPLRKRLLQVLVKDPGPLMYHAEIVKRDGRAVGYIRAASYGHTLGGAVGLAMAESDAPLDQAWIDDGRWSVDIAGRDYPAAASLRPLYDPAGVRIKA
jgi:4-methylaminobutanoate oxidase (formaldehyde-forming)